MRLVVIGGSDAGISAALRAREMRIGAHRLYLRISGDRQTGQLLGAQILGPRQAEVAKRIDVYATALFSGMTVDGINDLDLSYTPPFGSPWDAVHLAAQAWTSAAGGQP